MKERSLYTYLLEKKMTANTLIFSYIQVAKSKSVLKYTCEIQTDLVLIMKNALSLKVVTLF